MKNKKGNVAVIALIVVIVAITASVITWFVTMKLQTPTQQLEITQPIVPAITKTQPIATQQTIVDETSNWQTYQNEKLGFEINIPKKVDKGTIKTIENGDSVWIVAENSDEEKNNLIVRTQILKECLDFHGLFL